MKVVKTCLFTLILGVCFSNSLIAQEAKDTVSLRSEVDSILKEKYYTRIPNNDFDEIIASKISTEVDNKFNFWIIVIGVFITAIGTIGVYAFKNMIKQTIAEELKNQSNKYIEDYKLFEFEGRLKIVTKEFDDLVKANLVAEYTRLVPECEDLLKEIKTLDLKELKINKLLSKTIDQLTYMYYITLAADLPKMEELIKGHESLTDIPVTAYTNLAILYSELYALLGDESYKIHGIGYCEKASTKNPLYGESRGIHLLFYAIDFFINKKDEARENARKILQKVLKVNSLSFDTMNRLNRDRRKYGEYIENLENVLSKEFEDLSQKAATYALQNKLKSPVAWPKTTAPKVPTTP